MRWNRNEDRLATNCAKRGGRAPVRFLYLIPDEWIALFIKQVDYILVV